MKIQNSSPTRILVYTRLIPFKTQYRKAEAAKIPKRPNSLTRADGDDRAPRGTMSTRSQPCTAPPTKAPAERPRRAREMDRESVRFFLRKSQTEPKRASDSCKPGGLSTPGGCEQPCARVNAVSTPRAMPHCVRVSLSGVSNAGLGGSLVVRSRAQGGSFCFTVAPGLKTSAYFTLLSETSPWLRFMRLRMSTTSYAASTFCSLSSWFSYREIIWFFAFTISSEDALSLRPRNLRAPA
mmetsp:Transcript_4551/g.20734  ORF Transcript_4551/g.20734 Transcript_4551/m.20734 type:complete len:238 (-) Transcript_4551:231-944(-)